MHADRASLVLQKARCERIAYDSGMPEAPRSPCARGLAASDATAITPGRSVPISSRFPGHREGLAAAGGSSVSLRAEEGSRLPQQVSNGRCLELQLGDVLGDSLVRLFVEVKALGDRS